MSNLTAGTPSSSHLGTSAHQVCPMALHPGELRLPPFDIRDPPPRSQTLDVGGDSGDDPGEYPLARVTTMRVAEDPDAPSLLSCWLAADAEVQPEEDRVAQIVEARP